MKKLFSNFSFFLFLLFVPILRTDPFDDHFLDMFTLGFRTKSFHLNNDTFTGTSTTSHGEWKGWNEETRGIFTHDFHVGPMNRTSESVGTKVLTRTEQSFKGCSSTNEPVTIASHSVTSLSQMILVALWRQSFSSLFLEETSLNFLEEFSQLLGRILSNFRRILRRLFPSSSVRPQWQNFLVMGHTSVFFLCFFFLICSMSCLPSKRNLESSQQVSIRWKTFKIIHFFAPEICQFFVQSSRSSWQNVPKIHFVVMFNWTAKGSVHKNHVTVQLDYHVPWRGIHLMEEPFLMVTTSTK